MMKQEPVDYRNPLGISKREWTKVLGVNLALLLIVYTIALITTLSGNDFFLLNFHSEDLARIETTLRGWGIYPLVQTAFSTVETTIIASYVAKTKPKWWYAVGYFGVFVALNLILTATIGFVPSWITLVLGFVTCLVAVLVKGRDKRNILVSSARYLIALVVSLGLNEVIAIFRTKAASLWQKDIGNSWAFVLNIEYFLALALAFGFLTLLIPWEKGEKQCQMSPIAGGSSPTLTKSSRKNSLNAKQNLSNLPPRIRRRLRWTKIKVISIQTIAIIVIAALPWFAGKPVEFSLVYASFCLTRVILGFNRSLHFKSELSCVVIGALCFWGLTYLSPSVEVSIILSLVYGAGLALGFRLYWELHDLLVYKRASKNDRYAMLFVVFKGNVEARHIRGVMLAKGYRDEDEIKIVQLYMQKEKVEWIAQYMCFAKITIEKKLTEIATALYQQR